MLFTTIFNFKKIRKKEISACFIVKRAARTKRDFKRLVLSNLSPVAQRPHTRKLGFPRASSSILVPLASTGARSRAWEPLIRSPGAGSPIARTGCQRGQSLWMVRRRRLGICLTSSWPLTSEVRRRITSFRSWRPLRMLRPWLVCRYLAPISPN